MLDVNNVTKLCGLGLFIFVVEKSFSKAGKKDFAYIVDLAGFIFCMSIVIKMISNLFNTTESVFYNFF